MYGRKATGATVCVLGSSPRLKTAGPLYSSSEVAGAASDCGTSVCASAQKTQPDKSSDRASSSKGPPGVRYRQPFHSDAPHEACQAQRVRVTAAPCKRGAPHVRKRL